LFNELREENEDVDLPVERMKELLDTVDRERAFGRKYYLSIEEDLLLPVQYLKNFLAENSIIVRQIWLNRGYTLPNKDSKTEKVIDYKKRHTVDIPSGESHKRNTVAISKSLINELGYNFDKL